MENNPFVSIVNSIREDNKNQIPALYRLGTVSSVMPFAVDVAGTNQDSTSFFKSDMINSFEVGDHLFLMPIEDEQRYIILCKVVEI